MAFGALEKIVQECEKTGLELWEVIMREDLRERDASEEESMEKMRTLYQAMRDADAGYDKDMRSASRLVGGEGYKLQQAVENGNTICGSFIGRVMTRAMKMGECNACMRRIVAAPTAGSCGVIPAVFLTYQEEFGESEERMLQAMYVAAGIGQVIASRASISGAEGGCQAEIGSASAMAAGAVAWLRTGDAVCAMHGAAIAMKGLLGLACDPVAGLVEVPCVKRNVIGAVNALTSADMACAGIRSVIPPDEVFDAMADIGKLLPSSLRETGEGGLAATPRGRQIARDL